MEGGKRLFKGDSPKRNCFSNICKQSGCFVAYLPMRGDRPICKWKGVQYPRAKVGGKVAFHGDQLGRLSFRVNFRVNEVRRKTFCAHPCPPCCPSVRLSVLPVVRHSGGPSVQESVRPVMCPSSFSSIRLCVSPSVRPTDNIP